MQTDLMLHLTKVIQNIRTNGVAEGSTIDEQFASFHRQNPHVYSALRDLAIRTKRSGAKKYGMAGLFEVLRWTHTITTNGDEFKLNNNYRALYARLLMKNEPELAGFFNVRARVSLKHLNEADPT